MPIFEYRCETCGQVTEFLIIGQQGKLSCKQCGGEALTKLISAHNISASSSHDLGGPGHGGCCGNPNSCGTPGSCCSG
jgi:putative FmdB family regulatory protein